GFLTRGLARASIILRQEGPRALAHTIVEAVRQRLGHPSAERLAYLKQKAEADAQFDKAHGVDTGGVQHLYGLTIDSGNAAFGVNHIATDPQDFADALKRLDIVPGDATFVDLGAGKARALILAAAYPFPAIVGVEFAHELHRAGVANLTRTGATIQEPSRISLLLDDATQFEFPDGPIVLYLFNPFGGPVIEEVARRATQASRNRPIRLIYMNPVHANVWANLGWKILANERAYTIFAPPAG
ncbi:MAG TPA: class I SAM-dependent methyltransferase, partial [Sphingobium sp.]